MTSVNASDCDATSPNNLIHYLINGGWRDIFKIDPSTGVITVSTGAVFDPTLYGSAYHMTVLAVDGGSPSLSGTCEVDVTVIDVGSKSPHITTLSDVIMANVSEDAAVNTAFATIYAVNPAGSNRLQFGFVSGSAVGYDATGQQVANQTYLAVKTLCNYS